jgi:Mn2+/Fe2+ NRAMP family transporter
MSEDSTERLSRALRWSSWVPLASVLGIELYIRNFDGWGAWASAPLLLVPAIISLPVVILGLSECVATTRTRAPRLEAFLWTLVAAVPIVWLGVRRYFM